MDPCPSNAQQQAPQPAKVVGTSYRRSTAQAQQAAASTQDPSPSPDSHKVVRPVATAAISGRPHHIPRPLSVAGTSNISKGVSPPSVSPVFASFSGVSPINDSVAPPEANNGGLQSPFWKREEDERVVSSATPTKATTVPNTNDTIGNGCVAPPSGAPSFAVSGQQQQTTAAATASVAGTTQKETSSPTDDRTAHVNTFSAVNTSTNVKTRLASGTTPSLGPSAPSHAVPSKIAEKASPAVSESSSASASSAAVAGAATASVAKDPHRPLFAAASLRTVSPSASTSSTLPVRPQTQAAAGADDNDIVAITKPFPDATLRKKEIRKAAVQQSRQQSTVSAASAQSPATTTATNTSQSESETEKRRPQYQIPQPYAKVAENIGSGASGAPAHGQTGAPSTPQQNGRPKLGKVKHEPKQKKGSGLPTPQGHVDVPLVKPRYERKTRTTNQISVSDYASDTNTLGTVTDMLHQTSVEKLSVRHGENYYEGTVHFHTYSVFRHGAKKIIARSVGYASDGDLVFHRSDVGERSDSNNDSFAVVKRKTTEIHDAVCLDPRARRPMTDGEEEYLRRTKQLNKKKQKKYPGIKAPKNKKIRQRLMNDAVTATEDFRKAFARAERRFAAERRERRRAKGVDSSDSDYDTDDSDKSSSDNSFDENGNFRPRARGAFQNVPPRYHKLMHQEEAQHDAYLERVGLSNGPNGVASAKASPVPTPADPNSAEARFNLLNTRLRDESKRALVSEYLTGLINELDQDFSDYIRFSVPMVSQFTPPFGPVTPPFGALLPPAAMAGGAGSDCLKLPTPTSAGGVPDFAFPTKTITDCSGFASVNEASTTRLSSSYAAGISSGAGSIGNVIAAAFPSRPLVLKAQQERQQSSERVGGGDGNTTDATTTAANSAIPTPTDPLPPSFSFTTATQGKKGGTHSMTEIERVASVLPDNAPPPLSYSFRDGYGRLMCHAVASYYKLVSSSEEDKTSGSRKTFVQFPESKRARAMSMVLPPMPFLQFLRMKTRGNSATTASSETPTMGPASAYSAPPMMLHADTMPPNYQTGDVGAAPSSFPMYDADGQPLTKTAIRKLKKEQKEQDRIASGLPPSLATEEKSHVKQRKTRKHPSRSATGGVADSSRLPTNGRASVATSPEGDN